jgi:1-acyl-sn-glycerol-3-phosphate acyltransferase
LLKSSASAWSITGWSFTASPSTASTDPQPPSLGPRGIARVAGLVLLFLICVVPHLLSKLVLGHSAWPRRFLGWAGWIAGARVRLSGPPIRPHTLLVCNHTSWLDILVLGGATGCRFVSKDQLGHRFVHWLADQSGTLYIRRSRRKETREQALAIADALLEPRPVALFAEGTTGPGDRLLPFRPALLEAAAYAGRDIHIRPVAIDYGAAAAKVGWYEESGRDNVVRMLGRKGPLPVVIRVLDELPADRDRKALARLSSEAIDEALRPDSSRRAPAL